MKEEWKTVNQPELSDYMVSSLGRIWAKKREGKDGRMFKENLITNRDKKMDSVALTAQGQKKVYSVAKLVAKTFMPNYSLEQDSVIHIDNNVGNNKVSNLKWGTLPERYNAVRGIKGIIAKKDGKSKFYKTISACSRDLGIPQSNISACLSEKYTRETAHGYSFERIYRDKK